MSQAAVFIGVLAVCWLLVALPRRPLRDASRRLSTVRASAEFWEQRLGESERQLASLQDEAARLAAQANDSSSGADDSASWVADQIDSMLARAVRLQALFVERPGGAIPELSLLTELEWLRLARSVSLDSEEQVRWAMEATRETAERKFMNLLGTALRPYKAEHSRWPGSLEELVPYLNEPVSPAMLARYELQVSGPLTTDRLSGIDVVTVRQPVDPEYRSFYLALNDSGITSGFPAWREPLRKAEQAARHAYARNHGGSLPGQLDEFIDYVEPANIRRLLQAERQAGSIKHFGTTDRAGDFLEFLDRPEDRALAESIWPK